MVRMRVSRFSTLVDCLRLNRLSVCLDGMIRITLRIPTVLVVTLRAVVVRLFAVVHIGGRVDIGAFVLVIVRWPVVDIMQVLR